MMTIGAVAQQSGVPTKTIRYYEQIALIAPAERAPNGYRVYQLHTVELLRFIKRAREMGFSIEEVTELLALWRDSGRTAREVHAIASAHLQRIDRKIAELQSLRATVADLLDHCHGDDRPDCPILEDLASIPPKENP